MAENTSMKARLPVTSNGEHHSNDRHTSCTFAALRVCLFEAARCSHTQMGQVEKTGVKKSAVMQQFGQPPRFFRAPQGSPEPAVLTGLSRSCSPWNGSSWPTAAGGSLPGAGLA